jgi:simple sugar transport system substrate-binding protein
VLDGTWKTGPNLVGREGRRHRPGVDRRRRAGRDQGQARRGQGRPEGGTFHIWKGPLLDNDGKEVLAKDQVADDKFLGGVNFFVKGVEGKVPGAK